LRSMCVHFVVLVEPFWKKLFEREPRSLDLRPARLTDLERAKYKVHKIETLGVGFPRDAQVRCASSFKPAVDLQRK
jgi:hypothetical protein